MDFWIGLTIFAFGWAGGVYRVALWELTLDAYDWVRGQFK